MIIRVNRLPECQNGSVHIQRNGNPAFRIGNCTVEIKKEVFVLFHLLSYLNVIFLLIEK